MALRSSDNDEAMLGPFVPAAETSSFVFGTTSGGDITLPSGRILSDSTYLQQGDDLVLIGTDGTTFIVRDYFLLDNPPDLISADGARMTPALVDSFTPPEAAGQYAQAGQVAQAATPIGQVQNLTGQAFAVRADGTRAALRAGDPVFQGDVIETGDGGAVSLLFVDETTFALGDSARLALDEMVYNPSTQEGQSSFSILKGVFVFVSGQIAHTDNTKMTVTTPVATIGIRGTTVAGDVKPAGEESKFTVIEGEIAIITQGGSVVMSDPNATTLVSSFQAPPSPPVILTQEQVQANYGSTGGVSGGVGSPEDVSPEGGGGGGEGDGSFDTDSPLRVDQNPFRQDDDPLRDVIEPLNEEEEEEDEEEEDDDEEEDEEEEEDDDEEEDEEEEEEEIIEEEEVDINPFDFSNSEEDLNETGSAGADVIIGGNGNDILNGGDGNDVITGGAGDDVVNGGAGEDVLIAATGAGFDDYDGGDGLDTILFTSAIESVTVDLGERFADGVDIDNDFIINVENVVGGAGDDTIRGDNASNFLSGGGGNDILTGSGGSDFVFGDAGNDTIIASGDIANDFYDGGAGTDILDYSNVGSQIVFDISAGSATFNPGEAGAATDTFQNFETVIGGSSNDTFINITGNDSISTFDGGNGFDELVYNVSGLLFNFDAGTVSGAGFTDTFVNIETARTTVGVVNVLGSNNAEVFGGSAGSDTLDGGGGADELSGNLGDDTIIFDATDLLIDGGGGTDRLNVETSGNVIDLAAGGAPISFEIIDLAPAFNVAGEAVVEFGINTIFVEAGDIAGNTENDTLTIIGDGSNDIQSDTFWLFEGQVADGGNTFDQFTFDGATLLVDVRIGFAPLSNEVSFLGDGGLNLWSDPNNWNTQVVPIDGDIVELNSVGGLVDYDVGADTTLFSISGTNTLGISSGRLLLSDFTDFAGNIFMAGGTGFGGSGDINDLVVVDGDLTTAGESVDLVGSNGIFINGNLDLGGTVNLATDLAANNTVDFQNNFVAENSGGTMIMSAGSNGSATDANVTFNTLFSNAGNLDITRSTFTTDGFENLSGGNVIIDVGSNNSSLVSTGGMTNTGAITLDSSNNQEGESATVSVSGDVFTNAAGGIVNLINASSNVIDAQFVNVGAVNVSGFADTRFIGTSFDHLGGNINFALGSEIRIVGGSFNLNGGDATASGLATISMESGTLNVNSDFTAVSNLTFAFNGASEITGTQTFTNFGTFDVNTDLAFSGTLDASEGILDVLGGTALTFNSGGALIVSSDSQLNGAGSITIGNGASFDVAANTSFDLSSGGLEIELETGATIGGAGTFTNTGLADVFDVDITVDVDNLINQAGGTLQFGNNIVTINTANFSNDLNGTLELDATTGAARVQINTDWTNNGVINLTSDTDLVDAVLDLSANTLTNSASGVIKVGGLSSLTNHQITGNVQNDGNVLIENGGFAYGGNGTFANNGAIDVGDGNLLRTLLSAGTDSFINNAAGVINLNTGGSMQTSFGTVTNDGVLNMGTGALNIGDNSVFVQNSILTIGNGAIARVGFSGSGGTLGGSGLVTVDAGGEINLDVGGVLDVDTVNSGLVSSNNNTFTVNGTLTNEINGDVDFGNSGTLTGTGAFVNDGDVTMTTASNISIADFTNTGNILLDNGDFTITAGVNFTNEFGGTIQLDGTDGITRAFVSSDLTNDGVINLTNDVSGQRAQILMFGGSTLTNSATGVILVDGLTNVLHGITGNFQNDGLVDLAASVTTFEGANTYVNNGVIDIAAGARLLASTIGGSFSNTNTGAINLNGGLFQAASETVTNDGALNLSGSGQLLISDGGHFVQNTDVTFASGTSAQIGSSGTGGALTGTGTVTIESGALTTLSDGGTLGLDFQNSGNIILNGTIGNVFDLQNAIGANLAGGVINSNFNSTFDMGGNGQFTNASVLNINNTSTLTVQNGEFQNNATGVIDGTGTLAITADGVFTQDGGDLSVVFTNAGIINFQGADSTVNISGNGAQNSVGGLVNVIGNVTFDMDSDFSFSNFGDFVFSGGTLTTQNGQFRNETGGDMSGSGAVVGDITNAGGSFSVGASPGELTIFGNLSNGNTSQMTTELGGLVAGTEFDRLIVTETLSLGGTISIEEYDGFEVSAGDSFNIISAGEISGSFDEANGLDVGAGVVLDLTQSATDITLTGHAVTHQGDAGDNTLIGGAGDDVFSAGAGNDTVVGNGGADLVHTGDGDDVFVAPDTGFGRFDGGSGTDLVTFDGAGQNFDLTSLRGDQLSGIERIDFSGFGDNILTLDTDIAFAATGNENALTGEAHSLVIDGDAGDTLNAIGDWTITGAVTIEGNGYSVFQNSANDAQIFVDDDIAVGAA